jgi:hypothetical protein
MVSKVEVQVQGEFMLSKVEVQVQGEFMLSKVEVQVQGELKGRGWSRVLSLKNVDLTTVRFAAWRFCSYVLKGQNKAAEKRQLLCTKYCAVN